MNTDESRLAESLDQLTDVAAEAGLDPTAARDEGLRVAAALAEAVPGAAPAWAEVAHPGLTDPARINEAFFDAASSARRWRGAPTDLLDALITSRHTLAAEYAEALTEAASSAVMLGTAPRWLIATAPAASGACLAAAPLPSPALPGLPGGPLGGAPAMGFGSPDTMRPNVPGPIDQRLLELVRPGSPAAQGDPAGPPAAPGATATAAPTDAAAGPEKPAEPERSVEELLAELDAMIGLERVKKEIHRQVAL